MKDKVYQENTERKESVFGKNALSSRVKTKKTGFAFRKMEAILWNCKTMWYGKIISNRAYRLSMNSTERFSG
jgi:hypothetical protein